MKNANVSWLLNFRMRVRVNEKRSRMISGDEVEEFTFVICNALKYATRKATSRCNQLIIFNKRRHELRVYWFQHFFKLQFFRGLSRYHYKVKRDNRIQDIGN